MEQLSAVGVRLRLDEATAKVVARFDPHDAPPPSVPQLFQAVADQGFAQFWIDEHALTALSEHSHSAETPFDTVIGERRDGRFELDFSDDNMSVWLTLIPPYGGEPATQAVLDAITQQGIVFGMLQSSLQAALAAGHAERLLIAQGLYPQEGHSTRFESLLPEVKERRPQIDKNGIADYRNLGQLLIVHPGDLLMRRIPAQPGTDGKNVKGEALAAQPVVDTPFAQGLSGVVTVGDDANLLQADITGQPVKVSAGIMVNPVLVVDTVDLHTGNINFEGTVQVLNDIKAGMHVLATADVMVGGVIEAAEVKAGGDVVVTGGIVGRTDGHTDEATQTPALVHADGTVSARFAENAIIHSDHAILIQDIAVECELTAEEQILLGKAGSKYGHLVGGTAKAKKLIKALVLGAPSGTATRLVVGQDPPLYKQLASNGYALAKLQPELKSLLQLLVRYYSHPEDYPVALRSKLEQTRQMLQAQLNQLTAERKLLTAAVKQLEQACIEVGKDLYIGVEVEIGAKHWHAIDDWNGATTLLLLDGRICRGEEPLT